MRRSYIGYRRLLPLVLTLLILSSINLSWLVPFKVPTARASADWLSGWTKRVKITIDHNDVDSDLSDFPVLIYLSTSSGRSSDDVSFVFDELQSDANREKIAVTKDDGTTECYVEIEDWDDASEEAWLWVKVSGSSSISSTTDTDLYLYYDVDHADNSAYVGDSGSRTEVWDSNFVGVWHLNETPNDGVAGHLDSTSNNNDGTPQNFQDGGGGTTDATGKIGGADYFAGDDDEVLLPNQIIGDSTAWTLTVWIQTTSTDKQTIYGEGYDDDQYLYIDKDGQSPYVEFYLENPPYYPLFNGSINVVGTQFHHVTIVQRNQTNRELFVDGVSDEFNSQDSGTPSHDMASIGLLRNRDWTADPFNGTIDEVRISNTNRSAAWIKASYESERDDLVDFGSEETGEVDTYASDYSTLKDAYSIGETVYAKAEGLTSGGSVWLSGWGKRVKLTIDQNDVDSTLSNYPVLVFLSNSSAGRFNEDVSFIFDELQSDANRRKIAVTTSDMITECYVEIQRWDDANEQAWLWVEVPSVSSSADTDLYLYYDSDHADNTAYVGDPDSTAAENVWDSGFKGVWHLDEEGDGTLDEYKDSTQYNNHGQAGEGNSSYIPTRITGAIGYAQNFTDDLIDCGDGESLNITGYEITVECWINYPNNTHPNMGPYNRKGWYNGSRLIMGENSQKMQFQLPGQTHTLTMSQNIPNNTWHYIAAVYNSSHMMIYLDGAMDPTVLPKIDTIPPSGPENETWIGTGDQPIGEYWRYPWEGGIDEVRISNVTRNDAWIKATYESETDDLIDFGTEEIGVLYDFKYYSDWLGSPVLEWSDVKVGENPLTEWRSSYTLQGGDPTGVWGVRVYDAGTTTLRCSCNFTVAQVDTYESDYSTLKDTYSIGETVYAMAEYLASEGVWLSGWGNRVKLTIDRNDIDSDLSDFPVLIYLSTSSGRNNDDVSFVFDELQSDANQKKIAVTRGDKVTQCYVEIERWNDTAEEAWLWVKVPTAYGAVDTDLYLYYDSSQPNNTAYVGEIGSTPAQNVWESTFVGVWHLPEDPSDTAPQMKDSTSNSNHGTCNSSMTSSNQVQGKIDGSLDFDGTNDLVDMGDPNVLDMGTSDFTLEAWVKLNTPAAPTPYPTIVDKGAGAADQPGYWLFTMDSTGFTRLTTGNGTTRVQVDSVTDIKDGSWHYVVGVADRDVNGTIYIDGQFDATDDFSPHDGSSIDSAVNFAISCPDTNAKWYGGLDEVRVSNATRSVAWIKASFESGRDDLVDFGGEESGPLYDFKYYSDWSGSPTEEGSESNVGENPSGEWRSSYTLQGDDPTGTWGVRVYDAGTSNLRCSCSFTVQAVPEFPYGAAVALVIGFTFFLAKRKTAMKMGKES